MAELVLELVELCAVMAEEHSASPSTTEHPSRVQPPPHSTPANPAEVNAGSIVQRFTFKAEREDFGSVEDGFGMVVSRCAERCRVEVVRPGKVQCSPSCLLDHPEGLRRDAGRGRARNN